MLDALVVKKLVEVPLVATTLVSTAFTPEINVLISDVVVAVSANKLAI